MTPLEAARIYIDLLALHAEIPSDETVARDAVESLRSKYHGVLMDVLREASIAFADRFEAAGIAMDMIENGNTAQRY
jgi:hypothetical protein